MSVINIPAPSNEKNALFVTNANTSGTIDTPQSIIILILFPIYVFENNL